MGYRPVGRGCLRLCFDVHQERTNEVSRSKKHDMVDACAIFSLILVSIVTAVVWAVISDFRCTLLSVKRLGLLGR